MFCRATSSQDLPGRLGRTGVTSIRAAFTLIELLVVVVILTVLASLSLAGLAGARQRAKVDKTRSTIRKIDAVIRPMYDSYRTRRVTNATAPADVLLKKRTLIRFEMPDTWLDVPSSDGLLAGLDPVAQTATVRAYKTFRASNSAISNAYGAAECLYLIAARSGFEPDSLEMFRGDEVGDTDLASNGVTRGDGAFEFLDGWGRPIAFMRWAPGWVSDSIPVDNAVAIQWSSIQPLTSVTLPRRLSPIQIADKTDSHDPLDSSRSDPSAYALIPLIYSAGPDAATDTSDTVYSTTGLSAGYGLIYTYPPNLSTLCAIGSSAPSGTPDATTAYADNITNHDLSRR